MPESKNQVPRLSGLELLVLELLLEHPGRELYGLGMVEASKGALKRGTIYVTLHRMEEKKMISSRAEPRPDGQVGIPRRMYKVTGYGERVKQAHEQMAAFLAGAAGLVGA